jgi:hypothetical protein
MANYYTTRFNPLMWPPAGGAVPPGVEGGIEELRGAACCGAVEVGEAVSEALGERWAYRTAYRIACAEHGDAALLVETRLDWISPNEYLLVRSDPVKGAEP